MAQTYTEKKRPHHTNWLVNLYLSPKSLMLSKYQLQLISSRPKKKKIHIELG